MRRHFTHPVISSAVAGLVLAVQVIAGLMVCANSGNVRAAWGAPDADRPGAPASLDASTTELNAPHCLIASADQRALQAEIPTREIKSFLVGLLPHTASRQHAASRAVDRHPSRRGPPVDTLLSLQTVVLRI